MPPAFSSQTVLIVEDDVETRALYRDVLRDAGYSVVAVEDGLDALRRIEVDPIDAVVLDLMLPRVGGWDVYKDLRANPRTRRLPVVIVTASDVGDLESSAALHVLRKPVSPEKLTAAVDQAVRRRSITADEAGVG